MNKALESLKKFGKAAEQAAVELVKHIPYRRVNRITTSSMELVVYPGDGNENVIVVYERKLCGHGGIVTGYTRKSAIEKAVDEMNGECPECAELTRKLAKMLDAIIRGARANYSATDEIGGSNVGTDD